MPEYGPGLWGCKPDSHDGSLGMNWPSVQTRKITVHGSLARGPPTGEGMIPRSCNLPGEDRSCVKGVKILLSRKALGMTMRAYHSDVDNRSSAFRWGLMRIQKDFSYRTFVDPRVPPSSKLHQRPPVPVRSTSESLMSILIANCGASDPIPTTPAPPRIMARTTSTGPPRA